MSTLRQTARELVRVYDHILEQQIVGRGCSLACRDEKLWMEVEGMLKEADAVETHCLGLDPLRVMEESLKAAATSARALAYGRRVKSRGGLWGLAKAFEVLEQASLNLYLGPWREEYRHIKMYSGTFTHYITPVLSMPQIEYLFGLLGYQPSMSWPEQLCLSSPKVSPAFMDDLLRLSCAFFLARCECHLLLSALGRHVSDAQWELSMVRERQKGNSLQVALDNTRKNLEVSQPPLEPVVEEIYIYGEEWVKGEQNKAAVVDEESPSPLTNGAGCMSQPVDAGISRSPSSRKGKSKHSCEESESAKTDSKQIDASGRNKAQPDANHSCSCLQSLVLLKYCLECNAFHDLTCTFISVCKKRGHRVEFADSLPGRMDDGRETGPPSEIFKEDATNSPTSSSVALPSSAVCDDAKSPSLSVEPIRYHSCCDLAKPDPRVLCRSCNVFHSRSCAEGKSCQKNHTVSELGMCTCGLFCARNPLVLCRYCGKEYCTQCWFRNPVSCHCGQTFDQSSSV
uniref:Spermatogenesis associated 2-like n=1 Tax=Nothobranchius rachovii TaxID=451742 RepID=A0A1A8PLN4_9TELE